MCNKNDSIDILSDFERIVKKKKLLKSHSEVAIIWWKQPKESGIAISVCIASLGQSFVKYDHYQM